MAANASTDVRGDQVQSLETRVGIGGMLRLRTGAKPASAAAARSGTILAAIPLDADFLSDPVAGVATLQGTLSVAAIATGDIGHWEFVTSAGVCKLQGTITTEGVTVNDVTIDVIGKIVTAAGTFTGGNA